MRIALDARFIADHYPGIGRYFYQLLLRYARRPRGHTFLVLYHPDLPNTRHDLGVLAQTPEVQLVAAPLRPTSLRDQAQLPGLLVRLHADLYHTPYYVYPYIGLPCPAVVTLHDLIPLRFPRETPWRARLLFDLLHRLAIARATRMITVSTAAQADLVRTYRLKPDRMTVIPHAPGAAFGRQPAEAIAAVRARYDLPERYILSVGTNKPHKNHARLVEAFALIAGQVPDLALVIAGQADPRYRAVQAAVQQAGLAQRVRLLPNVAEADLPALYAGAFAFCLPSLYEGFGLPLVEAMASGAPVICGWQSSMPEVVGPAALLVDVRDPDAIGRAILRLDRDAALAAGLRAAGLQRAAQFSWERAARATLDVYESI